ncbi:MAG TPA: NnrS family protein, partial [Candidatus Eisenbacteria bacterium]|nr:NnrS family protein [Candidatus Eisenbacteria bacterium]
MSAPAPVRAEVRPAPPAAPVAPEPYRVLFPLGAALAIAGAAPWVANGLGRAAWPGPLHAALMVEGFELAFVCGFLLTAMVAFTHGPRAGRGELALAALGLSAFAVATFAGRAALAPAAFTLTLLVPVVALARRVRVGAAAPPEEFALVGVGLALGLAGGALQTLAALGLAAEPAPRFGLRLVSLGMVLCLVLGLGGLLVPTFMRLSEPLAIPG